MFAVVDQRDGQTGPRARALLAALEDVACDLRLVDVADLVTFARTENHPNLGDLVHSSLELYFKPDLFRYGWGADVRLRWDAPPAVMLDMEFRHLGVTVFFRLGLEAARAAVDLHYVSVQEPSVRPEENTRRLVEALADARLPAGPAARRRGQAAARP